MRRKNIDKVNYQRLVQIISLVVVLAALAVPRAMELDRFVTPDEPKWLHRSANFLTALVQKDFEHTYQREHPGITTMWAGAAGFLLRYPQFARIGPGQLDRIGDFHRFLENNGMDPIVLLESGRLFSVLGISSALLLAFYFARKVFGVAIAIPGFLFTAFNPLSIALARLLHLDGIVSALMLLSLLALMVYLYRGRQFPDLAVSAMAAGLSWLTKSPALFLLPFFGFLMLVEFIRSWRSAKKSFRALLRNDLLPFLIWSGISMVTFTILFPAMWVAPLDTINNIFVQALYYASEGHESNVFFNGSIYSGGVKNAWFYPAIYFWRTTPITVLGLFLLGSAFALRRKIQFNKELQKSALVLLLFVLLYTTFMTLGAKKFDRYLLPVFAPLDILAAVGWATMLTGTYQILRDRLTRTAQLKFVVVGFGMLLSFAFIWQFVSVMQTAPYYFSYYNPLLGGSERAPDVMMIGWGEGLDQAARYLNQSTEAGKLRVMSWYYDGPFSYFFNGTTLLEEYPKNLDDLPKVDYIIIYYHQLQRQLPSVEFLTFMEKQTLEYVVKIAGIPYAYIYRMY